MWNAVRSDIAWSLVRFAAWLHPSLMEEFVQDLCEVIVALPTPECSAND